MNNYLTYYDIDWKKYLHIFESYDYIQGLFIISPNEINKCLHIGNINDTYFLPLYDITSKKINKLTNLGPFITKKIYTEQLDDNIEKSMVNFYKNNKHFKWIGIVDKSISNELFSTNNFKNYIDNTFGNIAYIIPYRDRYDNLKKTVTNLQEYIKYQNLEADIWVIEQDRFGNWNKGTTCNCGFQILKDHYDYFTFNDADTYPNLSTKFYYPKENEINHIFGYEYCLGGVFSCNKKTFIKVNGFNNNFFNWGREDRDLEDRCKEKNVNINRNNLIKLHSDGMNQLDHENKFNYWNTEKNSNQYFSSRQLYYFNQIQHIKKEFNNGLKTLKTVSESSIKDNRNIIIFINLKKWTSGIITISSINKEIFKINTLPELDTGLIKIKYNNEEIELPVNPKEKYPKIEITIYNDNNDIDVSIRYSYLFQQDFKITNIITNNNYKIDYKNIDLDFDNIYTPFNNQKDDIKYNYYPVYKKDYYLINVNF